MKTIKKDLIKSIEKINNTEILRSLHYKINSAEINESIGHYIVDQNLTKVNNLQTFISNAISVEHDIDLSKEFMEDLKNDNVLKISPLLSGKKVSLEDIINKKYIKIIESLYDQIINAKRQGGDEGPGEIFFETISLSAHKANKGDLIINDREIELKSTQARFISSQIKYGSGTHELTNIGKKLTGLGFIVPTKEFGIKQGVLKSLNEWFENIDTKTKNKAIDIIKTGLENIYPSWGERVLKSFFNGKTFNNQDGKTETMKVFFEMYKEADGFEGILFVNKSNKSFKFISDSKLISLKDFSINWGPDFDKTRPQSVPQISLK